MKLHALRIYKVKFGFDYGWRFNNGNPYKYLHLGFVQFRWR